MNRFEPVRCVECGKRVPRKARQQKFCGNRCRGIAKQREYRTRQAMRRNGFEPLINAKHTVTPEPLPDPSKNRSQNNELRGVKNGSNPLFSAPREILGGMDLKWRSVMPLDSKMRDTVIRRELGDYPIRAAPNSERQTGDDEPSIGGDDRGGGRCVGYGGLVAP